MKTTRTSLFRNSKGLAIAILLMASALTGKAQCTMLNEAFDSNPALSATNVDGAWYPDRYRPAGFVSDVLGTGNVLKLSIDGTNDGLASRPPSYQSAFYNTQGRKFNQCGGCVTVLKADLYIPADWATKHRRSDIWATGFSSVNAVTIFPILGFRNVDGATPGIFAYDINTGAWINSGVSITYNSWYSLEMRLVGGNLEYLVNNAVVATLPAATTVYFGNVMVQAYNFNDPGLGVFADANASTNSYDSYWDNLVTTGTGGKVVTNTNTGLSFCTIQDAINDPLTAAGHVITVSPGTYNESVNINKSVNLRGAQTGICAPARSGAESIINAVNGIGVNASNVTIDGFTIQGQTNPNAGPGWGYAVYMAPGNTGTQLVNNIIRNNIIGSSLSNTGTSPAQVSITCNWYDNNNQPGPAGGNGIYTDEYVGGGVISNVMIGSNKFSANSGAGINLSISSQAVAATGITVSANEFTGNSRAIFLYNVNSSSFSANTVANSTFTGSGDVRIFGGVNGLSITNNSFTGGAATPHGIRITTDGVADNSNITVFENSFLGYNSTTRAIDLVSGYPAGNLPATCNWFGTTNAASIATMVSGSVNYTPWLTNGTDNAPATAGFQPVPNSCGPCPISCSIAFAPGVNVNTSTSPVTYYFGYGPGLTLAANATGGGSLSYAWSGSNLSCTDCQSPVFTPQAAGLYSFTVEVTNASGCKTTCSVTVCVKDIRVPGNGNNGKVYLCHVPNGNTANSTTLIVSASAVPSHLNGHAGDRLGKCDDQVCTPNARLVSPSSNNAVGEDLKVYPNPNNGTFVVEVPYTEEQTVITVTDVQGKVIRRQTVTSTDSRKVTLQLGDAARGMYLVEVTYGEHSFRTKLIVQ